MFKNYLEYTVISTTILKKRVFLYNKKNVRIIFKNHKYFWKIKKNIKLKKLIY